MRSSFVSRTGLVLAKTPSVRQQAARRRLLLACAIAGLALGSGLIGALTGPKTDTLAPSAASTGPFSYFPHQ